MNEGSETTGSARREMVETRVLDAPRETVWKAWTDPSRVARWWGPMGFTLPGCEMDLRRKGGYRFVMRGPDGTDYPFHGVYWDVVEPQRLVFTAIVDDAPDHEMLTAVTFTDHGGKTRLTVRQTVPKSEAHARGQQQGWSESLDRLAEYLSKA
jgi:uncharacterized protein YndB with AHSA1/START domain